MSKGPPKGSQFWKHRMTHGRPPLFADDTELWDACVKYFEWVEANPLIEEKLFNTPAKVRSHDVNRVHAMTITGLCFFLNISAQTWFNWREKDELKKVVEDVESVIWEQKFSYAAADMLNHSIIARELGLADKKELSGGLGLSDLSGAELDRRLAEMRRKTGNEEE